MTKGMTLVEVLLYIGLFALIFTGFIIFTFEFSRTVGISSKRADSVRVGLLIGELVRWKLHHEDKVVAPVMNASSSDLILSGGVNVTIADIDRIFRFEYTKPTLIYFSQDMYNGKNCIVVHFTYMEKEEVIIPLL